mgnify:CR=1 FL=1
MKKIDKINEIIERVREKGITAYVISKNTKISQAGIGKILNRSSKNPRELTVDAIYSYLFSNDEDKTQRGISERDINKVRKWLTDNEDELLADKGISNWLKLKILQANEDAFLRLKLQDKD